MLAPSGPKELYIVWKRARCDRLPTLQIVDRRGRPAIEIGEALDTRPSVGREFAAAIVA